MYRWRKVGIRLGDGGSKGDRHSPEALQAFEQPGHHDHHAPGHGSHVVAIAMYVVCVHGVYVVIDPAACGAGRGRNS